MYEILVDKIYRDIHFMREMRKKNYGENTTIRRNVTTDKGK